MELTKFFLKCYRLVVEHRDGLNSLNGMVVLDNSVSTRLALLVTAQLDGDAPTCQAEHLAKLFLVNGVDQLVNKINHD